MMNWFTPTMDAKELDKRIAELKTVQFWLDQNSKALSTTIQGLEVQKLTLAALETLNIHPQDTAIKDTFSHLSQTTTGELPSAEEQAAAMQNATELGLKSWEMLTQQFQQISSLVPTLTPDGFGGDASQAQAPKAASKSPTTKAKAKSKATAATKKPAVKKSPRASTKK